jgi:hypothetical protein
MISRLSKGERHQIWYDFGEWSIDRHVFSFYRDIDGHVVSFRY